MATLLKDEKGNLVRYRITPIVEEGHAAFEDVVASRMYDASGGRQCPRRDSMNLSGANQAALLAEIKGEVDKAIPAGTTLSTAKYEAEFWLAKGHAAVEDEAFAYPTVRYAADGPVAASEGKVVAKWAPSAAMKAALLAAALA